MAAPATKSDIKTIFEKLDKISRSLVDNSSSLAQLTEEILFFFIFFYFALFSFVPH